MNSGHILVVDDQPEICQLVSTILQDDGYQVTTAHHANDAIALCQIRQPDLILLDIWMPDMDGIALLKQWHANETPSFYVIMMSGHGTIETAVEATRLGAYDFLEKPLSTPKLLLTVSRAMEALQLVQENQRLKRHGFNIEEPLGESPLINNLRQRAKIVSRHSSPVLLYGELGSGKTALARYIHHLSKRNDQPFVTLRIGSIASENCQVAIFGRESNGRTYSGHLEQAHGGTLYLDEVADLDQETQARLLSALQESSLLRVDGTQAIAIDVRIIASTRVDLALAVSQQQFRDDLYFFLNVLPVTIPPLRDYAADIPGIVLHYSHQLIERDNMPHREFTQDALDYLARYQWPGNIRELKNLIQRTLILAEGSRITAQSIRNLLGKTLAINDQSTAFDLDIMHMPLKKAREQFEKEYILYQWQQTQGNVSQLAKKIGIERTHLYRKLKSLGIDHRKVTD